jgi:hypothetical protein
MKWSAAMAKTGVGDGYAGDRQTSYDGKGACDCPFGTWVHQRFSLVMQDEIWTLDVAKLSVPAPSIVAYYVQPAR